MLSKRILNRDFPIDEKDMRFTHRSKNAFTLIELLVVISIIALLLSIVVPALRRAKAQAKRIVCASNLKQIGLSLLMYGQENNENLPLNAADGWLWDIAYSTTDLIIACGADKHIFYCPAGQGSADDGRFWQFSQGLSPGTPAGSVPEPKTDREDHYRVTGYFWLLDTVDGRANQPAGRPRKRWVRKTTCRQPSLTDLVTDGTLSDGPDPDTASFSDVRGGSFSAYGLSDRTNHLTGGKTRPVGGNIVFVDGHVEWRRFNEMDACFSPPYHWW